MALNQDEIKNPGEPFPRTYHEGDFAEQAVITGMVGTAIFAVLYLAATATKFLDKTFLAKFF
jgi:hypothetical protein